MAIFAAILAIGKPVALEARAEERDTRGFISMTRTRPSLRVDGELDVAAAGVDADLADDRDADVAQPLVLAVGQGERRGDGDRVAGVHAHGVEVLDRADDDDVVGVVAHDLELELLPAQDRLLEQHLGRRAGLQPGPGDPAQLRLVVGQARPEPAHRERRAHDERVAQLVGRREHLGHGVGDARAGHLGAAPLHDPLERRAVLAEADRLDVGTDERARRTCPGRRARAAPSRC